VRHGFESPVLFAIVGMSLLQANNCVEEKEWIDILTKICQTNANRLKRYHPSAYINGHWLWWVQHAEGAEQCGGCWKYLEHHIPEDLNLLQHCCDTLNCCKVVGLFVGDTELKCVELVLIYIRHARKIKRV